MFFRIQVGKLRWSMSSFVLSALAMAPDSVTLPTLVLIVCIHGDSSMLEFRRQLNLAIDRTVLQVKSHLCYIRVQITFLTTICLLYYYELSGQISFAIKQFVTG